MPLTETQQSVLEFMYAGEWDIVEMARESESRAREMAESLSEQIAEYTGEEDRPTVEDCLAVLRSPEALECWRAEQGRLSAAV